MNQPTALRRTSVALASILLITSAVTTFGQLPAFPGAEGFGAYATGGRGGDVYTVVNLNSSGPGSLRYGVETAPVQGRTIVFAVSGYIPISNNSDTGNKTVRIVQNKVTIAGQTAPGDGIALKDGRILVTGNNEVIRHLRIRHGKYGGSGDCMNLESSADNSIIDHVSLMFSTDENISFFNSSLDNFTMQYSTSSWGMERHNAGGLWDLQHGSCHHSLWAHHRTRNPKARPQGLLEWINNVTYHWRSEGFIMGDSTTPINWYANVRGCYFLSINDYEFGFDNTPLSKARIATDGQPNFHLYLDNCRHDSNGDGLLNGTDKGYGIVAGLPYPTGGTTPGTVSYDKSLTPFAGATGTATVTIDDPLTAYKKVLSAGGALRMDATYAGPLRDELDTLLIESVKNQQSILIAKDTPRTPTIDHPEYANDPPSNGEALLAGPPYNISNGGFGTLNSAPAPTDSDGDGMPDFWENTLGWNPAGQDHNTVMPNSGGFVTGLTFFPQNTPAGYTRLEEYLHFLCLPHASIARNTAGSPSSLSVDLRRYASGFNKAPVTFSFSNITNGVVALQPDGYTAVFTPTLDFAGRARFDFTVLDGDGSSWTQTMAVLVSSVGVPKNLKWRGDGSANLWNTSTPNWLDGTNTVAFANGDYVRFDDTGSSSPDLNLTIAMIPASLEVNSTQDYTFGGIGALGGVAQVVKNGTGSLTLGTANTFIGGLELNAGNVTLANSTTAAGSGAINFNGGSLTLTAPGGPAVYNNPIAMSQPGTVFTPGSGNANQALGGPITGSATLSINTAGSGTFSARSGMTLSGYSGTIELTGPGFFRWQGGTGGSTTAFDLGNTTAVMMTRDGGTITLGSLAGGSGTTLRGAGSTATATTYVIGQKGSSTFNGTIADGNVSGSPVACVITKLGNSTLTLTGTNSHTGNTQIGAGTLRITGNNGPSPVIVSNGATLGGTGILGGLVTVNSGGKVEPGSSIGTLTVSGGLTLNSPTMLFELSGSPAGSSDKINMLGGLLSMSGTQNYQFSLTDGYLTSGTYTLIDGGANTSASEVGFSHNLPTGARQTFSLQRPASGNGQCYIQLVVTGDPTTVVWRGLLNSDWDTSTVNWVKTGGAISDHFYIFDSVLIDDSSSSTPTLNLTTSINPASILVDVSSARTFSGVGALTGFGTLTKAGAGTLTITTTNSSYGGNVLITGGAITLGTGSSLNTGNLTLAGGGTFNFPPSSPAYFYPGTITVPADQSGTIYSPGLGNGLNGPVVSGNANSILNISSGVSFGGTGSSQFDGFPGTIHILPGGTVRFSANSSGNTYGSLNPTFIVDGALRPRNAGNTVRLGALSGSGSIEGPQSNAGSGNTTYLIGGNNQDVTFSGNISSNSAVAGSLVVLNKVGSGKLTLNGSSTYTGGTTVAAGSLIVNATSGSGTGTGDLTITAGATLGGSGRIGSVTTLDDNSILSPGNSIGTLTFDNDLVLGEFTELDFQLGASSDRVTANAALSLAGILKVTNVAGFGPGTYTLFTYNPANTFSYSGLTLDTLPAGYEYAVSTNTPGQVNLIVSPTTPPAFGSTTVAGSNLILTGTGGTPGGDYYVLSSTNVALPIASWARLATNTFNASGNFNFTNSIAPGTPQRFYRLQLP